MRFILNLLILMGLCLGNSISAQPSMAESRNILFVGNSLIRYERNDLLLILEEFLKEKKVHKEIDNYTLDGAILWFLIHQKSTSKNRGVHVGNWRHGDLYHQIEQHAYDLMIVQEDSDNNLPFPSFTESLPLLDSLSKAGNIPFVILENYKRYIGKTSTLELDQVYAASYAERTLSVDSMRIIEYIPTGYFVKEFRKAYPKMKYRYSRGGTHPSKNVQFLLACVLYKYITGGKANDIEYNFTLKEKDAHLMKEFVDRTGT